EHLLAEEDNVLREDEAAAPSVEQLQVARAILSDRLTPLQVACESVAGIAPALQHRQGRGGVTTCKAVRPRPETPEEESNLKSAITLYGVSAKWFDENVVVEFSNGQKRQVFLAALGISPRR
ncbi:unnamed protein product, partial [Effrenium voratum]